MKDMSNYLQAVLAISEWNRIELVRLIENGLDVNECDDFGKTLLMEAAEFGNPQIIDILIKAGAYLNAQDCHGDTALMRLESKSYNVMHLIDSGADFSVRNEDGEDLYELMYFRRNTMVLDCMLKHDACRSKILQRSPYKRKETEVLFLLCQAGFEIGNVKSKTSQGMTLLEHFVVEDDFETVQMLLQYGANPNFADDFGRTPLHYTVMKGINAEIAYLLIKYGANVDALDIESNTPLNYIFYGGHSGLPSIYKSNTIRNLNILLENGATLYNMNAKLETPLKAICKTDDERLIWTMNSFIDDKWRYLKKL